MSDFQLESWHFGYFLWDSGSYLNLLLLLVFFDTILARKAGRWLVTVNRSTSLHFSLDHHWHLRWKYSWLILGRGGSPPWASANSILTGRDRSASLLLPKLSPLPHYHWAVVKILTVYHFFSDTTPAGRRRATLLLSAGWWDGPDSHVIPTDIQGWMGLITVQQDESCLSLLWHHPSRLVGSSV